MRRLLLGGLLLWAWPALAAPLMASKVGDMRQAMDDLTAAAMNHDMQLVKEQPIDTAMVKRGFDDPHVRIAFIGSETAVRWAEEVEPRLLNLLPMRISLIQRGNQVVAMTDDLALWQEAFKDSPGLELLQAWEAELREVLRDFAGE
ncbi:MAG TPA: hypothetical protein PKH69_12330 [Thiobacillaceae bacterium]|nr:hypothetical protein [Thiobacillaceae bacterium]HNU65297.1 hypothetical protein [Thiobacillaceae bacterium]